MLLALIAIVLGLLPGFGWMVFYLTEDPHAEPKRLIVFTFLAGIAFGFLAVIAEKFWNTSAANFGVEQFSIVSLIVLALIEELVKFAAAYFSISRTPEINDPVDPMVYMIVAALGFATLENIGTLANILPAHPHDIAGLLSAVSLRFVGATLLHSLTAGIVGYHWSLGIAKKRVGEFLLSGFIFATMMHVAFNYLILNAPNAAYPVLFLLLVGFFVLNDFEILRAKEVENKL